MPRVARGSFVIEGLICTDARSSAMGGQPGKPKPLGNPPIRQEPQRPQPIEEPPRPLPVPPMERPPLPMQASNSTYIKCRECRNGSGRMRMATTSPRRIHRRYVCEKATIDHLVKECYEATAPVRGPTDPRIEVLALIRSCDRTSSKNFRDCENLGCDLEIGLEMQ